MTRFEEDVARSLAVPGEIPAYDEIVARANEIAVYRRRRKWLVGALLGLLAIIAASLALLPSNRPDPLRANIISPTKGATGRAQD